MVVGDDHEIGDREARADECHVISRIPLWLSGIPNPVKRRLDQVQHITPRLLDRESRLVLTQINGVEDRDEHRPFNFDRIANGLRHDTYQCVSDRLYDNLLHGVSDRLDDKPLHGNGVHPDPLRLTSQTEIIREDEEVKEIDLSVPVQIANDRMSRRNQCQPYYQPDSSAHEIVPLSEHRVTYPGPLCTNFSSDLRLTIAPRPIGCHRRAPQGIASYGANWSAAPRRGRGAPSP